MWRRDLAADEKSRDPDAAFPAHNARPRMNAAQRALELARECGFDLAGIAPLHPPRDAAHFRDWLARGHHAGLDYLARDAERILDPRLDAPRGRSLLVVGLAHARPAPSLPGGARVARYALGRDYHNVLQKGLRKLRRRLQGEGLIPRDDPARAAVDAAPLLERSHAAEAGIGFASKAANLLHPSFGPWFFLGELVLDTELEPTTTLPSGSCGTCTACLDACPTGAILAPGRVDAGKCISYQTIENRSAIPHELRRTVGNWAFGCDICSEVCPWGAKAPDLGARFGLHAGVEGGVERWIGWRDDAQVAVELSGSALQRAGREGLARNGAIVLGNAPTAEGEAVLLHALSFDPSAIVREAAAWALAAGYARTEDVERALRSETDPQARDGMLRTLAERR
jgi:epoxyqueuosine reductase